jgi:hypothetical protein
MIEVLKQALEALELCNGAETVDGVVIYTDQEIAAIKEAIAELESQEPVGKLQEPTVERAWFTIDELNAWADKKLSENPHWVMPKDEPERNEPPLQRTEQEPFEDLAAELFAVAQISPADDGFSDTIDRIEMWLREHFSTPPQRTWVGLKDEDISEIVRGTHNTGSFVRAIEAKLKEKNT